MAENNENNTFQENVEALFRGMDAFLSTKAVVGEAVPVGDSLMIPLADVSFGLGAGALSATNKNNGGGGMGAKVSPAAVLLIAKDGTTKLVGSNVVSEGYYLYVELASNTQYGCVKKLQKNMGSRFFVFLPTLPMQLQSMLPHCC